MAESPGSPGTDPSFLDPLSEETRKARLYLLGASTVGITIVVTGLVPTEIRTLGITFAQADRRSLLFMLALVIAYFLVAFIIYAAADFLAWRVLFERDMRERLSKELMNKELDERIEQIRTSKDRPYEMEERTANILDQREREKEVEKLLRRHSRYVSYVRGPISLLRGIFEFLLPIFYGVYGIYLLLF